MKEDNYYAGAKLAPLEMNQVAEAIQGALDVVMNQVGPATREKYEEFLIEVILTEKPYLWMTEKGVKRLIEKIFGFDTRREFVFAIQYHFFIRWPCASTHYDHLVDALAWSCSIRETGYRANYNEGSPYLLVPPDIGSRMSTRENVKATLKENPWLAALMLLISYTKLPDNRGTPGNN